MDSLPDWIDPDAWDNWKRSRKAKKMTDRSALLALKQCYELHEKGHNVNDCLDHSAFMNYDGVFPVPVRNIPDLRRSEKAHSEFMAKAAEDDRKSQSPEAIKARELCKAALKVVNVK